MRINYLTLTQKIVANPSTSQRKSLISRNKNYRLFDMFDMGNKFL